jgi:hypothetical protein
MQNYWFKNWFLNWVLWFTPVIVCTQDAEIRRIAVQSHPEANRSETLS